MGQLIQQDSTLKRQQFKEGAKLLGISCLFYAPKDSKHYTIFSEIETNYELPVPVDVLFTEHPNQKTLKKIGWVSELQENQSIIEVPYDIKVEQGGMFLMPSGLDPKKGRFFRITSTENIMIFPDRYICGLAPLYEDSSDAGQNDYKHNSGNYLNVDF